MYVRTKKIARLLSSRLSNRAGKGHLFHPEVISHENLIAYNSEQDAKEAGKFATQARNRWSRMAT